MLHNSTLTPSFSLISATAPSGIGAPELLTRTSSSLTLTWQRPTVPNGLIVSYDITAMPVSTIGLVSPLGNITMVTVEVQEPEMILMATLTGLEPATTHSLYLTAYTAASGGTGSAVAIATLESGEPALNFEYIQKLIMVDILMHDQQLTLLIDQGREVLTNYI